MDTTSLGFQKPKEEEYYDINIFNKNTQLANDLIEKNSSAIGQIANDRGYISIKRLRTTVDLNTFFASGKYYTNESLNRPIDNEAYILEISGDGSTFVTQKATCYYGPGAVLNPNFGKEYIRTYFESSGGWTSWREIPTVNNISNPNLLINGDFQIWQRGSIFETGAGTVLGGRPYTTDRWRIGSDSGKIRVTKENGIKVTFLSNGNFIINQPTTIKELDLRGKKFTLSTKISSSKALTLNIYVSTDGINYMNLATTPILQKGITKLTAVMPDNVIMYVPEINGVGFVTSDTVNAEFIKLELGEIATPLSPRPYGEELVICQRYCVGGTMLGTPIYNIDNNNIWFFIPFVVSQRKHPTLIQGDLSVHYQGQPVTGFTFVQLYGQENGVRIALSKPNHGLTKDVTLFTTTAIFDSEIY